MSTKTLTKRVALATVVALGAGVLSLVSVTSAKAASNVAVGTVVQNPTAVAGAFNIASSVDTTTGAAVLTYGAATSYKSSGLLAVNDSTGSAYYNGTTQTATLLPTGAIVLYTSITANTSSNAANVVVFKVTNGTVKGYSGDSSITSVYGAGNASIALTSTGVSAGAVAASFAPSTGATSMTINAYEGASFASTDVFYGASAAAMANAAITSPTSGKLIGSVTVSIAAAGVAGTVSQTKSGVFYANGTTKATTSDDATNVTTPGLSNYATNQYSTIRVRDAYSNSITTGFVQAVATGGYVTLTTGGSNAPTVAPTTTSAVWNSTTEVDNIWLSAAPLSNAGGVVNVTVSYNGVVIGTKSFTFTGDVAKVVLSNARSAKILATGTTDKSGGNYVTVAYYDAQGNPVYPTAGSAVYPSTLVKSAAGGTTGTGISYKAVTEPTSTTAGIAYYGCGNVNAVGALQVDYSNADGVVVSSNVIGVSCSGSAASYTAKLDKATYAPGDVATLTVTFKDASGALAADETATATAGKGIADGTTAPTVAPGSTVWTAISGPTATDVTTNGVITYKYSVGTTTGSFNAVVDFPRVDATGGVSAVSVPFKVVDSSGTSLNDVLKGIVSLIASINKQIAALAKLVTKK
jgi:trimeric autotransporter adhesin